MDAVISQEGSNKLESMFRIVVLHVAVFRDDAHQMGNKTWTNCIYLRGSDKMSCTKGKRVVCKLIIPSNTIFPFG